MADHPPKDLVRAEQIDDILAGICDEPCAVQDVASGCSCAMARQIVKNLQMTAVHHLGQIKRLRAAADGARREAITECIGLANDAAAARDAVVRAGLAMHAAGNASVFEFNTKCHEMHEACAALAALEKEEG